MKTSLPFQDQQPVFEKMGGISELTHMSQEDREKYWWSLNRYRTTLSVMKNERAEGREEGREEGRAEGREEGLAEGICIGDKNRQIAIARQMKADGFSIEMIQKYTELSLEEIENL